MITSHFKLPCNCFNFNKNKHVLLKQKKEEDDTFLKNIYFYFLKSKYHMVIFNGV